MRRARDRFVASDPGLTRLSEATRTVVAIGLAVGVVILFTGATLAHVGPTIIAGVVAWESSIAVTDPDVKGRRVTTLLGAFPALFGSLLCSAVSAIPILLDACFLAIIFFAAYVRRFGPRWTAFGWFATITYFVTVFAGLQSVPLLDVVAAVVSGSVSAFVVRFLLLPQSPAWTSRLMLLAFEARARLVLGDTHDVLEGRHGSRARLRRSIALLNQTALSIEEQLAERDGEHGRPRLIVFDAELAVENVAMRALAMQSAERAGLCIEALRLVLQGRLDEARSLASAIRDAEDLSSSASEREFGAALVEMIAAVRRTRAAAARRRDRAPAEGLAQPSAEAPKPSAPFDVTTRQALQVTAAAACAIVLGEMISPDRWYWSVLAAFLVFTGTASSGETISRAWRRIVGTALGVLAAVLLGSLVVHSPARDIALVFVSVFFAIYFLRYDYGFMMFFVTIMLATLFGLLGRFSDQLLLIRLVETIVGALLGGLAAVLIVPARTKDVAREAAAQALDAIRQVVRASISHIVGESGEFAPVQAARVLDERLREFSLRSRPLVSSLTVFGGHRDVQRWSVALQACGYYSRSLARIAKGSAPVSQPELVRALCELETTMVEEIGTAAAALRAEACRDGSAPVSFDALHRIEHREPPSTIVMATYLLERLSQSVRQLARTGAVSAA